MSDLNDAQSPLAAMEPASGKKSAPKKSKKAKSGVAKPSRTFPALTLEEAIKVPTAIKTNNGGNPWAPSELAKALGITPKGTKMWYITSSSRDYGLTSGTRDTERVELTEAGRNLVYPASRDMELKAISAAFFNVAVFKNVFDYYKGGDLPEIKFLENTLENVFKIHPNHHTEFYSVFVANKKYIESFPEIVGGGLKPASLQSKISHAVVVGQPKSGSSLKAFVAMPFSEKTQKYPKGFYLEVLRNLITPAGVEAGFEVETARKDGSDIIHATIVNDLIDADLVIVDLSDHNPNVLFELGLRMAHDKPIALIRAEGTAPIFDVDQLLRVLEYNPNLWKSTIELDLPKLTEHIKAVWKNRDTKRTYMKILRGENGS